jgi:hypothetical protein
MAPSVLATETKKPLQLPPGRNPRETLGREACARALTAVGFDANGAYSTQTPRWLSSKHVKVAGCSGLLDHGSTSQR